MAAITLTPNAPRHGAWCLGPVIRVSNVLIVQKLLFMLSRMLQHRSQPHCISILVSVDRRLRRVFGASYKDCEVRSLTVSDTIEQHVRQPSTSRDASRSRVDLVLAHRASCCHKIISMVLFGLDNEGGEVPRRRRSRRRVTV
jgi:hypothetical protein